MSNERIQWQYFPKSERCPVALRKLVDVFDRNIMKIASLQNVGQSSNDALAALRPDLESLGYQVERDKTALGKIRVPVLFGKNGTVEKSFEADAHHVADQVVLEVEAGRGVTNYQFLKDLFQACVMQDVEYLAIAVRQDYRGSDDFSKVVSFIETLFSSTRLVLPLKGILIVGY